MSNDIQTNEIMNCPRGAVVAPAGCGKTELITSTLAAHACKKPILVLTHTTAGVAALKKRLRAKGIPATSYIINTIDGWVLKIVQSFPQSCPVTTRVDNPRNFYPEIRSVASNFLQSEAIVDVLQATYSRLLVDEYQDCDLNQHNIIKIISNVLPTVIFADPMQCIFNFRGVVMPDWESDVLTTFPLIGELTTPWRWINAGAPNLGQWILEARTTLMSGQKIDLRAVSEHLIWHEIPKNTMGMFSRQHNRVHNTLISQYPQDSLIVIGSSVNPRARHNFAKQSFSIQTVEPVDMSDIIEATKKLDECRDCGLLNTLLDTMASIMTNVDASTTKKRLSSIINQKNRTPPDQFESALLSVYQNSDYASILNALEVFSLKDGTRIYRNSAYKLLKEALDIAVSCPGKSINESAQAIRERIRHQGDRCIPRRAIGSTLLLKGLEADHCLILDANDRNMDSKHLYVALSRGAKTINVFSRSPMIG